MADNWLIPIHRNKVNDRRALLDKITMDRRGEFLVVEYSLDRATANARTIVGKVLGTAWTTSGSTDVLVVDPVSSTKRLVAISAAHLVRISAVGSAFNDDPVLTDDLDQQYRLGEPIAGPTRKGTTHHG